MNLSKIVREKYILKNNTASGKNVLLAYNNIINGLGDYMLFGKYPVASNCISIPEGIVPNLGKVVQKKEGDICKNETLFSIPSINAHLRIKSYIEPSGHSRSSTPEFDSDSVSSLGVEFTYFDITSADDLDIVRTVLRNSGLELK
ncbi:MAG: hypothetical protein KKF48_00715 [Nanoarchaeota archaeon]|nr:hypothetical protein [Nanoarchaeota archaeon]MBU1027545.1 hypothetical protein [Nanoarchaeota archaeon]